MSKGRESQEDSSSWRDARTRVAVAHTRIRSAQKTGMKALDLSNLGLTSVPDELFKLTQLRTLHLTGNHLQSLPPAINHLTSLRELRLDRNDLGSLPHEIGALTELVKLELRFNRLRTLPPEIGKLKNLAVIDAGQNAIEVIPEQIGLLKHLNHLSLSHNSITHLPRGMESLQGLAVLHLDQNFVGSLPDWISGMRSLRVLRLAKNRLQSLPAEIGSLTNLEELSLEWNELETLPDEFAGLERLQRLDLRSNMLRTLPWGMQRLALRELYLHQNPELAMPPEVLGPQPGLSVATGLVTPAKPSEILSFYFAVRVAEETPLNTAEPASTGEAGADVATPSKARSGGSKHGGRTGGEPRNKGRASKDAAPASSPPPTDASPADPPAPPVLRRLNECKLLVLGQGKVGKTSLVNRLIRDTFDPDEEKTEGIAREPWMIPTRPEFADEPAEAGGGGVTLNVWDFGGQEVMHATHQFFLTQRSVYLVVLDARQGEDKGKIQYWLQMVRTYGGDSPVIVVINQCDPPSPGHPTIDLNLNESRLKLDHPSIKAFIKTSCLSGRGIEPLRTLIREQVHAMEHVYNKLPPGWHETKQELAAAAASRNFVDESVFREIAERRGVKDAGLRRQLLRLLHDLGTVLNYSDEDDPYRLNETHILDPKWVTRGVYRLLNEHELFQSHGRLPRRDVKKYLREADGYSNAGREFIIGMMKKFQLCFDLNMDGHNGVLIPELLKKDEPPLPWGAPGTLAFEYHYDVLPEGVLPRFIVLSHSKHAGGRGGAGGCWRSGVVLEDEGCRVLVRGDTVKGKVYIHVQPLTKQAVPLRRLALRTARVWFDEIHQNLPARAMVPLTDDPDAPPVKYTYLCELERKKGLDYTWPPDGASRDYSVRELLEGIEEHRPAFGDRGSAWSPTY